MPILVARTVVVTAPVDVVLEYLRDFGNAERWDPSARRTTRTDAGPIGVGSTWCHEARVLGVRTELTYTLAAADAARLVFVGRNESATSTGTVTARPADGGTEVTYHVELEMHGLAKLATPVLRAEAEKLGDATAGRLTEVLNRLASAA
jgi:carbon monoxide dehydrogenase subunit G